MRDEWAARLALLLFGCLLAFLVLEGLTRLAFPSKKESDSLWQPDPLLGWTSIPNRSGFYRGPEFGEIPVAINSKGLRDAEYGYAKPEDAFRILVLGDSYAQAPQVPAEDSFPKLLEAQLNGRHPPSVRFEAINTGVIGYGTDQELLFFRREGYRYHPDLVILTFCTINDVLNNSPELELKNLADRKQFFVLTDGELELREFAFSEPSPSDQHRSLRDAIRSILNRSRFYQVVRRSFGARTQGMTRVEVRSGEDQDSEPGKPGAITTMPIHYGIYAPQYTQVWEEAWDVTRAIILQLRDEVVEHDARLLVVVVTTGEELYSAWRHMIPEDWDLDKPNRILGQFLQQNGIPHVALLPHFRKDYQESGSYLHFRVDGHWMAEGHRLAAAVIYDYLAQQEWLP
jgi:hypothetical protein